MDAGIQSRNDAKMYRPILFAWFLCAIATLGSLFFSEVMKLPPCNLCWYQRIGLFPLLAIFTVGILTSDKNVTRYAWPVLSFGLAMAIYHNLLYYGVIPETLAPCTAGASCTSGQMVWFGFVTIPLLSLVTFLLIGVCLLIFRRNQE